MRFRKLHAGVAAAALMGWAAASAQAADLDFVPLEQPSEQYGTALGLGVDVFELPSLPLGDYAGGNGRFDRNTRNTVVGPSLSAAIGGQLGDTPYSLELFGTYSWLSGDDDASQTFTGPGALVIGGPTALARGSIDLCAGPCGGAGGVSATSSVTATNTAGANASSFQSTFSPPGGSSLLGGLSPLPDGGGAFTAVGTDGTTGRAVAFGGVGDNRGFTLAAVGDLGGVRVRSNVDEDVEQGVVELRFGSGIAIGNGWGFTPTVAPTYRRIERDVSTTTTFDLASDPLIIAGFPTIRVDTDENLNADYYGGNLGGTFSGPISDNFSVNLGADVGVAYYDASYDVTARARVFGNGACPNCDVFDTGRFRGPDQDDDGTAYLARVRGGIGYTSGRFSVSLNGQAEYLSDVPTLDRANFGTVTNNATTLQVAAGDPLATSRLATDDMWSYGATVAVRYGF